MNNNFEVYTLFSSSKGNSVYVRYNDTRVLIDAGRPMKAVSDALKAIGSSLGEIDAIFVTHAHSDHVKGIPVICAHYDIPVHMTAGTADEFYGKSGAQSDGIIRHDVRFTVSVGELKIHSFVTPHDSYDSVGYIIESADYTLGVCTDTGCISREMAAELVHCNGAIIESNYDSDMLHKGPYPYFLKRRIDANTGHLSNEKCAELVCLLAKAGVKKIMLAHLSPENNLPQKALSASCAALSRIGMTDVDISVADKMLPTRF